jgi:hypothetical protein
LSTPNLFAADIPAGWLAIITGIGGAISLFLRTLWNGKNKEIEDRDKVIAARDATIISLRDKIDKMQEEALKAIRDQLELSQKRQETDNRVARSLEGFGLSLKDIVDKVKP